mgnify:CR=1 FL=1
MQIEERHLSWRWELYYSEVSFLTIQTMRCWEKRVSYKSRKDIAEQRTRIRGKFAPSGLMVSTSSRTTASESLFDRSMAHASKLVGENSQATVDIWYCDDATTKVSCCDNMSSARFY